MPGIFVPAIGNSRHGELSAGHRRCLEGFDMIGTKSELWYILLTRLLEKAAAAGLLTLDELYAAKRLAWDRYRPQTVWES